MTTTATFKLTPRRASEWHGRYGRVPGDTTVIHVRRIDGRWWPVIDWTIEDETAHCRMVEGGDAEALVAAVLEGKRALGAPPGGCFLVNEFGQVLVPANDTLRTRVAVVGECAGTFAFHNAFRPGEVIDLADDRQLRAGDPWRRPYVGVPHNLSAAGEIYFKLVDVTGTGYVKPPTQDDGLISNLRRVRPHGAVRFLTGVGGIVLTKVEVARAWEPRYVGRIDFASWFSKEG